MAPKIESISQAIAYFKKIWKESLGIYTVIPNDQNITIELLNTTKKIEYKDIESIRLWFGGDPFAPTRGRLLTAFFLIDIKEWEKPLEIKHPLARKLFHKEYEPIDMSIIKTIQAKNPNVAIDQSLLDYMRTGNLNYIFKTNTIYSDQLKPMIYLSVGMIIVMGLYYLLMSIIRLVK